MSIKLAPESDPDAHTNPELSPPLVRVSTQDRHQRIAVLPNIPPETERRVIRALVELHDSRTAAKPTAERTAEAAEWKARIKPKFPFIALRNSRCGNGLQ